MTLQCKQCKINLNWKLNLEAPVGKVKENKIAFSRQVLAISTPPPGEGFLENENARMHFWSNLLAGKGWTTRYGKGLIVFIWILRLYIYLYCWGPRGESSSTKWRSKIVWGNVRNQPAEIRKEFSPTYEGEQHIEAAGILQNISLSIFFCYLSEGYINMINMSILHCQHGEWSNQPCETTPLTQWTDAAP